MAEEVLSQLQHIGRIEKLVEDDASARRIAVVPRTVVQWFIASIKSTLAATESINRASQHAEDVLKSSTFAVTITPSLDPKAFCALFCGENLRVETLGLVYAVAGRYHLNYVSAWHGEGKDDSFVRQLLRCGDLSLRLARELSPQRQ